MNSQDIYRAANAAVSRIDWTKQAALFRVQNWTWRGEQPTADQMEDTARRLAFQLADKDETHASTGGIFLVRTAGSVSCIVGHGVTEGIGHV